MSPLAQQVFALATVALCGLYLLRALWRTARGRRAGLGNCCAHGCATPPATQPKTHFVPASALAARALARRRGQS